MTACAVPLPRFSISLMFHTGLRGYCRVSVFDKAARQIFATMSRTHSDLPPEELVEKQLYTVMDRKHQDKVARLPPQGDTRATFHPLVFTTGG